MSCFQTPVLGCEDWQKTLQGLLDELDVIESLEVPGKDSIYGEVLERQAKVYEAMGVTPPKTASLCVSGI